MPRRYRQSSGRFRALLLALSSIAIISLLAIILIRTNDAATITNCLPTDAVCATSLDPNPPTTGGSISWIQSEIGAVTRRLRNNSLTIITIAFVGLLMILALVGRRLFLSGSSTKPRKNSRKVFRGDRTLAALNSIDAEAAALEAALDRIKGILGESTDSGQPQSALHSILRAAGRETPRPDAQQILIRVAKEIAGVVSNLTTIRKTLNTTRAGSPGWLPSKTPSADLSPEISRLESLLERKNHQIDSQQAEKDALTKRVDDSLSELKQSRKELEAALRAKSDADSLIKKYATDLPSFINTREEGSRFPTFLEFLSNAHSLCPDEASRLSIMLRVVASAMLRSENSFELIWGIHEVGKSLYATMQALGYDNSVCYEEASAWACALNKYGQGKFTVFIPAERSAFSGLEMTGGAPQTIVQEIKSWGVRNKLGDVERKAIVK